MVENHESDAPLRVYLHIPATGGVSLSAALKSAVPDLVEMRSQEQIEGFNLMSVENRSQITALAGHIPYGVHSFLGRECVYATMLRHPIDRLISTCTKQIVADGRELSDVTIRDFLLPDSRPVADNMLVRRLCSYEWPISDIHWSWRTSFGGVTHEMFEQAKLNLSRCAFVGIYEKYEESARQTFEVFDLPKHDVPRLNVSKYDRARLAPSAEDRQALEELNRFDTALYQLAVEMFPHSTTPRD